MNSEDDEGLLGFDSELQPVFGSHEKEQVESSSTSEDSLPSAEIKARPSAPIQSDAIPRRPIRVRKDVKFCGTPAPMSKKKIPIDPLHKQINS